MGKRIQRPRVTFFHFYPSSKMCSIDEPGRSKNIEVRGPFRIDDYDFYAYRWNLCPEDTLRVLNDILMRCFAGSNHTASELLDKKDTQEAEDTEIVIGTPHGTENPISDVQCFGFVERYDDDPKQDILPSWHINRLCIPAEYRARGLLTKFFKFCVQYFPRDRPFDLYSSIQTLNSVNALKRLNIYKRYGFRVDDDTYVEISSRQWGLLDSDVDGEAILYDPKNQKRILKKGNDIRNTVLRCTDYEGYDIACLMIATHEDIERALATRGGTRRRRRSKNLRQKSRRRRYA